jgi:hypothetical protein
MRRTQLKFTIVITWALLTTFLFGSTVVSSSVAYAQQQPEKSSVDYIENARSLLKQVSTEYKNGNYTKAEEIAGMAYLDNFEYAEADLQKHGQSALVSEIEKLMVTDLRGMIGNRVSQERLDAQISSIDAKLTQAIAVVPEFPLPLLAAMIGIASVIGYSRIKNLKHCREAGALASHSFFVN